MPITDGNSIPRSVMPIYSHNADSARGADVSITAVSARRLSGSAYEVLSDVTFTAAGSTGGVGRCIVGTTLPNPPIYIKRGGSRAGLCLGEARPAQAGPAHPQCAQITLARASSRWCGRAAVLLDHRSPLRSAHVQAARGIARSGRVAVVESADGYRSGVLRRRPGYRPGVLRAQTEPRSCDSDGTQPTEIEVDRAGWCQPEDKYARPMGGKPRMISTHASSGR